MNRIRNQQGPNSSTALPYEKLEPRQLMAGQVTNFDLVDSGEYIGAMYAKMQNDTGIAAWNATQVNGVLHVTEDGQLSAGDSSRRGRDSFTLDFDEKRELISSILLAVSSDFKGALMLHDRTGNIREISLSGKNAGGSLPVTVGEHVGAATLIVNQGTASAKNVTYADGTEPHETIGLPRMKDPLNTDNLHLVPFGSPDTWAARVDAVMATWDAVKEEIDAERAAYQPILDALRASTTMTVTTQINVLKAGKILENELVSLGYGISSNVKTGKGLHGSVVLNGVLLSIGDKKGTAGTVTNPKGTDDIILSFPTALLGVSKINVKKFTTASAGNVVVEKANGTVQTFAIPSNGIINWPKTVAIKTISMINTNSTVKLGVISITVDVQTIVPPTAENLLHANNVQKALDRLTAKANVRDLDTAVLQPIIQAEQTRQATLHQLLTEVQQAEAEKRRVFTELPPPEALTQILTRLRDTTITNADRLTLETARDAIASEHADADIFISTVDQLLKTIDALNLNWTLDGSTDYEADLQERKTMLDALTDSMAYAGEMYLKQGELVGVLSPELSMAKMRLVEAADKMQNAMANYAEEVHKTRFSLDRKSWNALPMAENFSPRTTSIAPSGKLLLSGSNDGRLTLHAAGTGEVLTTLKSFGQEIRSVNFVDDNTAVIVTPSSMVLMSLDGTVLQERTFPREPRLRQIFTADRSFMIAHAHPTSGGYLAFRYSKEGELMDETYLNAMTVDFHYSEDPSAMVVADTLTVNYSNGQGGGFVVGANVGAAGLSHVLVDGQGTQARVFVVGATGNIRVLSANGTSLTMRNLHQDGFHTRDRIIETIRMLGPGLVGVTTRDNYNVPETFILQFAGNALNIVSHTEANSTDMQPLRDDSGVLLSGTSGATIQPYPSYIQEQASFIAIASTLSPINFDGIPQDVAGMQATAQYKAYFSELVAQYSNDPRFSLSIDYVWQKYFETNPHMTNAALQAQYGSGSAFQNAIYVRDAEFHGMYGNHIGNFSNDLGRMLRAGFNALVKEAVFEDPTADLQELASAAANSSLHRFESIGIMGPGMGEVIEKVRSAVTSDTACFSGWQSDVNKEGQTLQARMNSPSYAGGGGLGSLTPRQALEQARLAEQEYWLSQQPYYNAQGVQIGVGGLTYAQMGNGEGVGGFDADLHVLSGMGNYDFIADGMVRTFDINDPQAISQRKAAWSEALKRYVDGVPMGGSYQIETQTAAGRIIAGAAQRLHALGTVPENHYEFNKILNQLSLITGIQTTRFSDNDGFVTKQMGTLCFFPAKFQSFLETAQYGNIFTSSNLPNFAILNTNKPAPNEYTTAETITLRFDAPASYRSVDLMVTIDNAPLQLLTPLRSDEKTLFLKVSVAEILSQYEMSAAHVRFTLRVTLDDGSTISCNTASGILLSETPTFQLSTNPDTVAARKEDKILSILLANFPLRNLDDYYWNIGSGYHDSEQYHAADLNNKAGGDSDRGTEIHASSEGVLRIGNILYGEVSVEHTARIDGENVVWKEGHLHTPIFRTGRFERVRVWENGQEIEAEREIYIIREQMKDGTARDTDRYIQVWDGKHILADDVYAFIGGRQGMKTDGSGYNEMLGNAHDHFWADYGNGAIDPRMLLAEAGLDTVKAFDYGVDNIMGTADDTSRNITWNTSLQTFVNTDEMLVVDRRPQLPGSTGGGASIRWLAWEDGKTLEQMTEMKFDDRLGYKKWYKWNSQTNNWYNDENSKRKYWNGFEFLTEL